MKLSLKQLKILVIENSLVQFEVIRILLVEEIGIEEKNLTRASSLAELKEKVKGQNLILLDLTIEDPERLETVSLTRKISDESFIVVLTNTEDDELSLRALQKGAQDYIPKKEVTTSILKKSILNALERNKVMNDMKNLNKELAEANQAKNIFLGMAAHDLRTPLGQISSYTEILTDELEKTIDEDSFKILKIIKERSGFMFNIINDLLDVTKIESGEVRIEKKKENLVKIIDIIVDANKKLAQKKNIKIKKLYDKTNLIAEFDPNKMEQVITNLLTNAIKYSHEKTQIEVNVKDEGSQAIISVKDQGQGIPKNEVSRLFQAFNKTSTKPTAGESSTGLGLVIVKKIVQAHDGKISVLSECGKGSTFTIKFPK